jgi:hypothetical protein
MTDDHLFVDTGGAQYRGRETMRSGWIGYFCMVPDYTIDVQETVADGPVVIVVGTARGTYSHDGNMDPADRWSTPGAWRAGRRLAGVRRQRAHPSDHAQVWAGRISCNSLKPQNDGSLCFRAAHFRSRVADE